VRAMICPAQGAPLVLDEVTLPPLQPNQVLIRTAASGICHTDLSFIQGAGGPRVTFPILLGHEAAGRVERVGESVTRCKAGDLVIGSILPACGSCWHCIRSETQHCDHRAGIYGGHFVTTSDGREASVMAGLGAFAEMMQVDEISVVAVASDLPVEQLAMIGCGVTTGVGAVLWTAQVRPGAVVAIFGCGGVGQSAIQGARIAGCDRIFAIDPAPMKRAAALRFGATDVIDPGAVDAVAALREATNGRGVDYAFEVTGLPHVVEQAFAAVRVRGTAVAVGMPSFDAKVTVPGRALFLEEKRLIGSLYGSAQVREHLPMLVRLAEAGKLQLDGMVSNRIGLQQINDAFDAMIAGTAIRSVVCY